MFEQARLEQMNQELNENIIHNQIKDNNTDPDNNNDGPQNIDDLLNNIEKDEINFD